MSHIVRLLARQYVDDVAPSIRTRYKTKHNFPWEFLFSLTSSFRYTPITQGATHLVFDSILVNWRLNSILISKKLTIFQRFADEEIADECERNKDDAIQQHRFDAIHNYSIPHCLCVVVVVVRQKKKTLIFVSKFMFSFFPFFLVYLCVCTIRCDFSFIQFTQLCKLAESRTNTSIRPVRILFFWQNSLTTLCHRSQLGNGDDTFNCKCLSSLPGRNRLYLL